ncbi:hypothetical protein B5P44_30720 [Mycobacterium sp. CBMA 213]|nr:hypothetical protein [Mycolicibacterium sp. CBMA 213]
MQGYLEDHEESGELAARYALRNRIAAGRPIGRHFLASAVDLPWCGDIGRCLLGRREESQ